MWMNEIEVNNMCKTFRCSGMLCSLNIFQVHLCSLCFEKDFEFRDMLKVDTISGIEVL